VIGEHNEDLVDAYKAGFEDCEAKMLADVANAPGTEIDFQVWTEGYHHVAVDLFAIHFKEAFTAGAMSQAKRIDALEKEQVRHIELLQEEYGKVIRGLEEDNKTLTKALWAIRNEMRIARKELEAIEALKQGGER
jgi:hypothetical protein